MIKVNIKPLTVNQCWQGRRFKTDAYKKYERSLLYILPKISLPEKPYRLTILYGVSNLASDVDNPTKPFIDVLQKKYKFNDKDIMELCLRKTKVNKGNEFIQFTFTTFSDVEPNVDSVITRMDCDPLI